MFSPKSFYASLPIVMVLNGYLLDFDELEGQLETYALMDQCRIPRTWASAEDLLGVLRDYTKGNHPDLDVKSTPCNVERSNEIRDRVRRLGVARVSWAMHSYGVAATQAKLMVFIAAILLCALFLRAGNLLSMILQHSCTVNPQAAETSTGETYESSNESVDRIQTRQCTYSSYAPCMNVERANAEGGIQTRQRSSSVGRSPGIAGPGLKTMMITCLAAVVSGSPHELMVKTTHAEFIYGRPPCAQYCGEVASTCTYHGWFLYNTHYTYWYDAKENICKSYQLVQPKGVTDYMTKHVITASIVSVLADGKLGFDDFANIFMGYKITEYHWELDKDLKLLKGAQAMLTEKPKVEL